MCRFGVSKVAVRDCGRNFEKFQKNLSFFSIKSCGNRLGGKIRKISVNVSRKIQQLAVKEKFLKKFAPIG